MPINFNPQETDSLMALLAGLRGGMDPATAYGVYGDVLGQQSVRHDERQQRLDTLTDLLTNAATGGLTGQPTSYQGAQALADAYTHGSTMPPRIEDTLSSLYPVASNAPQAAAMMPPSATAGNAQYAQQLAPQQQQFSPAAPTPDPMEAQMQQQQYDLGQQQLEQAEAAASSAPAIAEAFAAEALRKLTVPNATTGEPQTPESILAAMVVSDEFMGLDPGTQAAIVDAVKRAFSPQGQPQGQSGAAPPPPQTGPGFGEHVFGSFSQPGAWNYDTGDTGWQDAFGLFPGLFG